ncbi:hypothetical protein [Streptomyces fagopyri]|uniref:hypothetical protein n=1 Tax=Streptomyces fagopyri TaxID=2662397 RepID=UPI003721314B
MTTAVLEGIGGFVPPRAVADDELPVLWCADDAWVRGRGGIGERRGAAPGVRFGNTGAASLSPALTLADAGARGELRVPLAGFGAGPTWGSAAPLWPEFPSVPQLDGVVPPETVPVAPAA